MGRDDSLDIIQKLRIVKFLVQGRAGNCCKNTQREKLSIFLPTRRGEQAEDCLLATGQVLMFGTVRAAVNGFELSA